MGSECLDVVIIGDLGDRRSALMGMAMIFSWLSYDSYYFDIGSLKQVIEDDCARVVSAKKDDTMLSAGVALHREFPAG